MVNNVSNTVLYAAQYSWSYYLLEEKIMKTSVRGSLFGGSEDDDDDDDCVQF